MRPREVDDDDFYSRESETQRLLVRDQAHRSEISAAPRLHLGRDLGCISTASRAQRVGARAQDTTLRHLSSSVDRVQGIAIRVNEEIRDQNRMLDDIDDQVHPLRQ